MISLSLVILIMRKEIKERDEFIHTMIVKEIDNSKIYRNNRYIFTHNLDENDHDYMAKILSYDLNMIQGFNLLHSKIEIFYMNEFNDNYSGIFYNLYLYFSSYESLLMGWIHSGPSQEEFDVYLEDMEKLLDFTKEISPFFYSDFRKKDKDIISSEKRELEEKIVNFIDELKSEPLKELYQFHKMN